MLSLLEPPGRHSCHNHLEKLQQLLALVDDKQRPNINELWRIAKDIEGIELKHQKFSVMSWRSASSMLFLQDNNPPNPVQSA